MFGELRKNESGAVAILAALALVVLIAAAGVAIDYGNGVRIRTALQSATDSATLTAARKLAEGASWSEAREFGESLFKANTAAYPGGTIKLSKDGGDPASVSGEAHIPWARSLTRMFDKSDSTIRVASTAKQELQIVEVIFVADVSYSMGIGASVADVNIMTQAIRCAFACHTDGTDKKAHDAGAKLRVDVIREAYQTAIADIRALKKDGDVVRVGLITFSNSVVDEIEPSDNLSEMEAKADRITFPPSDNQGGTDLHVAADTVTAMIKQRKALNPRSTKYVVIWLTDGIEDTKMVLPGRRGSHDLTIPITEPNVNLEADSYQMTFATDLCQSMKDQGAIVMVMNTEYVTTGYSSYTANYIKRVLLPILPSRLAQCTGDENLVKSASDPKGILDAVRQLTKLAITGKFHISS